MQRADREYETLQTAIAALQATVGLKAVKVDVHPITNDHLNPKPDAVLPIILNGHKQLFVAEIKTIDRRIAVAQIRAQLREFMTQRYPGYRLLLITTFATPDLAEECRRLDLPFLDTAGSLYLPTDTFVADIRGKARPARPFKDNCRANNPTRLKVVFALLCRPVLAGPHAGKLPNLRRSPLEPSAQFSTTSPNAGTFKRPKRRMEPFSEKRTAQRMGHLLSFKPASHA